MRVYVPLTVPGLAALRDRGSYGGAVWTAHAVTPALQEWYAESDLEELEHAAFTAAARSALRLLAADSSAPRIRVVVSADLPAEKVTTATEDDRSMVLVGEPLALQDVASVHVDDDGARPDVDAAVSSLPAALNGDEDAQFVVDGAEGHDLLWYDASELGELVDELLGRYGR
jgi:hypothetical protein